MEDFGNDHGLVYYFENRKLRSPPGYSNDDIVSSKSKRFKNEDETTNNVTLKQGSLLKMCFKYVSENIAILDSLVGLPEIIGKELFMFMVTNGVLQLYQIPYEEEHQQLMKDNNTVLRCITVFTEAYNSLILRSLSLCSLSKSIPSISSLLNCFGDLVELDLSDNNLENEVLSTFSNLTKLKCLVLSNCGLSDSSIQKLTVPYRMYSLRSKEMQVLDLQDNMNITSKCFKSLIIFSSLLTLNLSNTSVMEHNFSYIYLKKHNWEIKNKQPENYKKPITEGWAEKIIADIHKCGKESKHKPSKKTKYFYSSSNVTIKKKRRTDNRIGNLLFFIRTFYSDKHIGESKIISQSLKGELKSKTSFCGEVTIQEEEEDIDDDNEDIFLQYKTNKNSSEIIHERKSLFNELDAAS